MVLMASGDLFDKQLVLTLHCLLMSNWSGPTNRYAALEMRWKILTEVTHAEAVVMGCMV